MVPHNGDALQIIRKWDNMAGRAVILVANKTDLVRLRAISTNGKFSTGYKKILRIFSIFNQTENHLVILQREEALPAAKA